MIRRMPSCNNRYILKRVCVPEEKTEIIFLKKQLQWMKGVRKGDTVLCTAIYISWSRQTEHGFPFKILKMKMIKTGKQI